MAGHTTLLNICMIPSSAVAVQCVSLSQSFDDAIVRFRLGDGLFPHATIYMARFEYSSLPAVRNTLQETISKLQPIKLIHSGYYQTPGQYIEVSYQRTEELLMLHHQVVQAVKRYRYKPKAPEYESFWGAYEDQQQKYAKQTGYDLAYDLYRPHITLTRYKEGRTPAEFPAFPQADLSFMLPKIALYKADANGAIYEEVATFEIT